jgi:hypothetical protein
MTVRIHLRIPYSPPHISLGSFDHLMQSALAIVQCGANVANTRETQPRTLRPATTRTPRPSSPAANLSQTDLTVEEANPDLPINYVDNYVHHHVDHSVADTV